MVLTNRPINAMHEERPHQPGGERIEFNELLIDDLFLLFVAGFLFFLLR